MGFNRAAGCVSEGMGARNWVDDVAPPVVVCVWWGGHGKGQGLAPWESGGRLWGPPRRPSLPNPPAAVT